LCSGSTAFMPFVFNEIGILRDLLAFHVTPLFSYISCQTAAYFSMILPENFLPELFVFNLQL
jgi:hypothetical protein